MIDFQIYFQKITLWIKKRKLSVWSLEKKIIAISFWDSCKCNFLSNCFGAGTEKKLHEVVSWGPQHSLMDFKY